MGKAEFLSDLRMALAGRVEADQAAEHVRYYEEYINMQIRMGKSEAEVLAALGSPRLIAKTITSAGQTREREEYYEEDAGMGAKPRRTILGAFLQLPHWLRVVLLLAVASMVFYVIFAVVTFLIPFLVPVLVVLLLVKFFRDWLK